MGLHASSQHNPLYQLHTCMHANVIYRNNESVQRHVLTHTHTHTQWDVCVVEPCKRSDFHPCWSSSCANVLQRRFRWTNDYLRDSSSVGCDFHVINFFSVILAFSFLLLEKKFGKLSQHFRIQHIMLNMYVQLRSGDSLPKKNPTNSNIIYSSSSC